MNSVSIDLFYLIAAIAVFAVMTSFYLWHQLNKKESDLEFMKHKHARIYKENFSMKVEIGALEAELGKNNKEIDISLLESEAQKEVA